MLNSKNERELAYIVKIDEIRPISGRDRVECAVVNGWTIMVRKNQFKPGDYGVYFEIDSQLPEVEPFMFLESKHFKIKTQKYKTPDGQFWSQGLLMSFSDFVDDTGSVPSWLTEINLAIAAGTDILDCDLRFLTNKLKVTYAVASDNTRKRNPSNKYDIMARRHKKIFSKPIVKKIMKYPIGRKILFALFGKRTDKKHAWPSHIATKTDVERIQNMTWVLNNKQPFVATEKVDGSSCSVMAEKTKFGKIKYYVCSRNVVFNNSNSNKCYYDTNIYIEAYQKYNLKQKITEMMNELNVSNLAIQMEIYGEGVQKRDYSTKEKKIAVFHIVSNGVKYPMDKVVDLCTKYDLPHVPIIDNNFIFPDTIEELQSYVESEKSQIDGKEKEGIVFYDKETGNLYTKFVSPEFLIKYHN